MEIDLRGKRPSLDFDQLHPGDILPLKVRGVAVTAESEVSVSVETVSPLEIKSGSVRINYGGESTAFISAVDASPYVMELAVDESEVAGVPSVYSESALLMTFGSAVTDENAPTLEHSEIGVLPGFVRRVTDRVFVIPLAVKTFALAGGFDPIAPAEITVEETEAGDATTRAEYLLSFSDVPDGGFWIIYDDDAESGKLHHSASGWEIERNLIGSAITGYKVYAVERNPNVFSLIANAPGESGPVTVSTHFLAPSGFTAELDLTELNLRASLAGIRAESCILSVKVDGVTVFSDLMPLMRLFDGGFLNVSP